MRDKGVNRNIRLALGLFLYAAVGILRAQDPTATLVGTVLDPSGAAVQGASVEVRDTGTNEARKTTSGQKGEFTVANLNPGIYNVTVTKEGFHLLHESRLELQLDQQARMEFHLQLGSQSERVEVMATAPLINTENESKGDVMVAQEMVEMPLDGRNAWDLSKLTGGVIYVGNQGDANEVPPQCVV